MSLKLPFLVQQLMLPRTHKITLSHSHRSNILDIYYIKTSMNLNY